MTYVQRALVLVVAGGLCVAGCSSGGGKRGARAPSTSRVANAPHASTSSGKDCFVEPTAPGKPFTPCPPLTLGQCPTAYPEPAKLNGGVSGLRDTLVPITALEVRLCRYSMSGGLVGSATFGPPAAAQLEQEANHFAGLPPGAPLPGCPSTPRVNFVTFADNAHRVDIADEGGCGYITNGMLIADPTAKWFNELARFTGANALNPSTTTVP